MRRYVTSLNIDTRMYCADENGGEMRGRGAIGATRANEVRVFVCVPHTATITMDD